MDFPVNFFCFSDAQFTWESVGNALVRAFKLFLGSSPQTEEFTPITFTEWRARREPYMRVIFLGLSGCLFAPHCLSRCHGSRYNSSFAAIGAIEGPDSVQHSTFQPRRRGVIRTFPYSRISSATMAHKYNRKWWIIISLLILILLMSLQPSQSRNSWTYVHRYCAKKTHDHDMW